MIFVELAAVMGIVGNAFTTMMYFIMLYLQQGGRIVFGSRNQLIKRSDCCAPAEALVVHDLIMQRPESQSKGPLLYTSVFVTSTPGSRQFNNSNHQTSEQNISLHFFFFLKFHLIEFMGCKSNEKRQSCTM